jgi:hypothetical protein
LSAGGGVLKVVFVAVLDHGGTFVPGWRGEGGSEGKGMGREGERKKKKKTDTYLNIRKETKWRFIYTM